jgi:hypothetical protein
VGKAEEEIGCVWKKKFSIQVILKPMKNTIFSYVHEVLYSFFLALKDQNNL